MAHHQVNHQISDVTFQQMVYQKLQQKQQQFLSKDGYDAGKRAFFGDDVTQRNSSILARFFFAQFVVSTSETLAYSCDTVKRRLMMSAGQRVILNIQELLIVLQKYYQSKDLQDSLKKSLNYLKICWFYHQSQSFIMNSKNQFEKDGKY